MTSTITNIALASVTPILTTVFVPTATGCVDGSLTMLANRGYQIWNNIPVPVAGTTVTECLPSQYLSSFLLSAGGVTQPAFAPLVCPQSWTTIGPYTSNYIACCPSAYKLAAPTVSVNSDRPAFGGTCYSDFTSGSSYLVTFYGSSSVTGTSYYTETATTDQAFAYPIDGYAYGVAALQSVSTTSGSTASKTSSNSLASSTSGSSSSSSTATSTSSSTADSTAKKSNSVAIGVGVGVSLAVVLGLIAAFFLWRRRRQSKAAHSAIASEVDGHAEEQSMEPKVPATAETELDTAKVAEMPLRTDEGHELHGYATPYEMESEHHYEMEGSNNFKR